MEFITSPGADIMTYGSSKRRKSTAIALKNPVDEGPTIHLEDGTFGPSRKMRKMYFAAFSALLMAVAMGIAVGYSAPATYDMTTRPLSPIQPTKDDITWIGSVLAIGAVSGGLLAGK
ncbi:hypothetical protein NPIL_96131 [Nephila pilipes]|uniref:Uncharacterized protein n=1 Tax=Nephila pilipes TaxID=299642 RepID=A0A8X6PX74_NEPPI|nr:hypothetical protein NPIL_96131 [Nephila pilipes]